jgi:hypothetical protein
MTGWDAALDDLEGRLATAAADPSLPVPEFTTPHVSGPPGPDQAARAADLLRRGAQVVADLQAARDALIAELTRPVLVRGSSPAASMIDTRV